MELCTNKGEKYLGKVNVEKKYGTIIINNVRFTYVI